MARVVADDGGAHAAAVLRMHGLHVRAMRRIRHRRVRHAAVMHGDVIHAHAGHASHIRLAVHARPHANEVAASMQRASLATLFHALSLRLASIMRRIRHRRVRHAAVMHGDVIHAHAGHASHIRLAGHASRIRTAGAHARPHANEVAASMQRASLATLFHALSLRLASIMPVRPASMRSLR
jgi:hypothetical protein